VLDEFYRIAFRKKIYRTIAELQADLDAWLVDYCFLYCPSSDRSHSAIRL